MRMKIESREKLAHLRMMQGIERDLDYLELVEFMPGAPISALARLCGNSEAAAREHIRNLASLKQVRIFSVKTGRERSTKVIYPLGMKVNL